MIQSPQRDDAVPHRAAEGGGRSRLAFRNSLDVLSSIRAEAGTDGMPHSWRPVPVGQRRLREGGLYRGGPVSRLKARDFEVQDWEVSRYLVYLNNRAAGKGSVKTIDLCDQKPAPLTPK